jgi:hypothetical protein
MYAAASFFFALCNRVALHVLSKQNVDRDRILCQDTCRAEHPRVEEEHELVGVPWPNALIAVALCT